MIEKIKTRLRKSSNPGIFHDSRSDINTLKTVINEQTDKINELVHELNKISAERNLFKI